MKIIFNSEREKEKFFDGMAWRNDVCPEDIGISVAKDNCRNANSCRECWEGCICYEVLQEVPVVESVPVEEFIDMVEKAFKEVSDENHI